VSARIRKCYNTRANTWVRLYKPFYGCFFYLKCSNARISIRGMVRHPHHHQPMPIGNQHRRRIISLQKRRQPTRRSDIQLFLHPRPHAHIRGHRLNYHRLSCQHPIRSNVPASLHEQNHRARSDHRRVLLIRHHQTADTIAFTLPRKAQQARRIRSNWRIPARHAFRAVILPNRRRTIFRLTHPTRTTQRLRHGTPILLRARHRNPSRHPRHRRSIRHEILLQILPKNQQIRTMDPNHNRRHLHHNRRILHLDIFDRALLGIGSFLQA